MSAANTAGPKRSDYLIVETSDPSTLKATLTAALGVRGVVRKTRRLYLVGQTRVHLDEVEGLGQFMELEVVLRPEQSNAEGQAIADGFNGKTGRGRIGSARRRVLWICRKRIHEIKGRIFP